LPAVSPGSRVYAVGDIHGRADLLAEIHRRIGADAAAAGASRKVVVYIGDYVDRGFESREVIDLLLDEPLAGFEAVHLKGNHEEILLRFLDDTSVGALWLFNGGDKTLYSYGVEVPAGFPDEGWFATAQSEFRQKLPPAHLEFLRSLRLSHMEGDYLLVHAGIRPGVPFEEQSEHDRLWIREGFLDSAADFGKIVVHGHTITPEPELLANRIGIDTGAYRSGHLTCLVLEGESRRLLQT
jgi:serine/threonine protein phosphatase 1